MVKRWDTASFRYAKAPDLRRREPQKRPQAVASFSAENYITPKRKWDAPIPQPRPSAWANSATSRENHTTTHPQPRARVGIYADQRIGELLRELPTKQGQRSDLTSVGAPSKVETERLEYARRLAAIESAKARERMTLGVNDPEGGRAREKVVKALSVGDKTPKQGMRTDTTLVPEGTEVTTHSDAPEEVRS